VSESTKTNLRLNSAKTKEILFGANVRPGKSGHVVQERRSIDKLHRVSENKTPTHIIGYKLRNRCLILIIFGDKIRAISFTR